MANPLLTNIPCIDQPPDPIEQEIPGSLPILCRYKGHGRKAKQNDGDIDLTDTFLGQSFKHEITNSLSSSLSDKQTDLRDNKSESSHYSSILNDQGQGQDLVSRSQLCKKQHNDPEILPLFERAFDEKEIDPVCFYVKNGILMRKWRPPDVSADDEWTVNHQIVVPRVYRPEISNLAHETLMSGHLGVNKTYHNILNHEGIHLLLFAVRESLQGTLGFSPFELVFGHTVRGPLKLLKEKFLSNDDNSLNLLQYVSDF